MKQGLLTATEAAAILRVKPATVVRMCRAGEIPATRPVKAWLIDKADLDAHLASHSNEPQSA